MATRYPLTALRSPNPSGADGQAAVALGLSPMSLRRPPRPGTPVTILYLDEQVRGVIEHVSGDEHRVDVLTEEGTLATFTLNRATARFIGVGPDAGARLLFGAEAGS
jgi:hypothetical protein